jgi:hypothetical protein
MPKAVNTVGSIDALPSCINPTVACTQLITVKKQNPAALKRRTQFEDRLTF